MKYYQRLKDLREDNDMKQADVAELLRVKQQQYSRWESGKYMMPIEYYKILPKKYNTSIDYLSGLIPEPRKLYRDK